jgi:hypothetical protein
MVLVGEDELEAERDLLVPWSRSDAGLFVIRVPERGARSVKLAPAEILATYLITGLG